MPEQPFKMSFIELANTLNNTETLWATITDEVVWNCDSLVDDEQTKVAFSDQSYQVVIIATYSDPLNCDDVQEKDLTGIYRLVREKRLEVLKKNGFDFDHYNETSIYLDACMYCGRGNSLGAVCISVIMMIAGIYLYIMGPRLTRAELNSGRGYFPA